MTTKIPNDQSYVGLPWKDGGREREGLDCKGLAELFLSEQFDFVPMAASTPFKEQGKDGMAQQFAPAFREIRERGDVVFFRQRSIGKITHVAVHLGGGKLLHTLRGMQSRIDNGPTLLKRLGFDPVGAISWRDAEVVSRLLKDPQIGDVVTPIVGLVISIILSLAVSFLTPKPKLPQQRQQYGRYGFDALITQTSSEIPLPDILGKVSVAGNSPYQTPLDKSQTVTDPTLQKLNKIIVLCEGPVSLVDTDAFNLTINGIQFNNPFFKSSATVNGFGLNPDQTKAEAVTGTIDGASNVPSISVYPGTYFIDVPVDVRAQYDRNFPLYGFSGCTYLVMRLIDSTKFTQLNIVATIQGRFCRRFDGFGFLTNDVTNEQDTGDATTVRFKLSNDDLVRVDSITVGGVTFTEMSETNQSGNVFSANKTKGYIEFLTAPGNGVSLVFNYRAYIREWTQNPAQHLVYLLTEKVRGMGFSESSISWDDANQLQDYCGEYIDLVSNGGTVQQPRYRCNYVIDYRKPAEEHIRPILDACMSYCFRSGGKWVMRAKRGADSVFSFDISNILRDSFSSDTRPRLERSNQIKAFIHSVDTFNAETEVRKDDQLDQESRAEKFGGDGILDESLKFPAVDNFAQGELLASNYLNDDLNTKELVTLTSNIQGIAIEPGDIVDITHPTRPSWTSKPFRVDSIDYDQEDRMVVRASEYIEPAIL